MGEIQEKRTYYYFYTDEIEHKFSSLVFFSSTLPQEDVIKFFWHSSFYIPGKTWWDKLYQLHNSRLDSNIRFENSRDIDQYLDVVGLVDMVNKTVPFKQKNLFKQLSTKEGRSEFCTNIFLHFFIFTPVILLLDLLIFSLVIPLTIIWFSFLMLTVVGALYVVLFHHWIWLFYPLIWLDLAVDPFKNSTERDIFPVTRFMKKIAERV